MILERDSARPWSLRLEPRVWQQKALEKWGATFHGVVSVVTGAGKTVFAEMCMHSFRKKYPSGKILVIVPTITLLDQWVVSLQEEMCVPKEDIACYSGEEKSSEPRAINLMVINTARTLAPSLVPGSDIFLIVDECHRAGSPMNSLALNIAAKASLGLSATPERDYDNAFNERIAPALGDIIYSYGYVQALADGVVSPFELINVRVTLLPKEQEKYEKLTMRARLEARRLELEGGSDEKLKMILARRAAVSATAALRVPVAVKLAEREKGARTLVFHERILASNAILKMLGEHRHRATIYHSGLDPAIRRDNLRLYRRGLKDIMVTCRALDEGMNVPETTVAIIASATASRRQRIQRLGRVLRPAAGKRSATIYTIYATDQEENRLKNEALNLEGASKITWLRGTYSSHGKNPLS